MCAYMCVCVRIEWLATHICVFVGVQCVSWLLEGSASLISYAVHVRCTIGACYMHVYVCLYAYMSMCV